MGVQSDVQDESMDDQSETRARSHSDSGMTLELGAGRGRGRGRGTPASMPHEVALRIARRRAQRLSQVLREKVWCACVHLCLEIEN